MFEDLRSQFQQRLSSVGDDPDHGVITVSSLPPFEVDLVRFGDTALLAMWVNAQDQTPERQGKVTAISIVMAGRQEKENEAWRTARDLLVEIGSPEAASYIKIMMAHIGEQPRPLIATVCTTVEAYDNHPLQYAERARALEFFGTVAET